jgi:hypothetical protein
MLGAPTGPPVRMLSPDGLGRTHYGLDHHLNLSTCLRKAGMGDIPETPDIRRGGGGGGGMQRTYAHLC